jgi:hypothetical protein
MAKDLEGPGASLNLTTVVADSVDGMVRASGRPRRWDSAASIHAQDFIVVAFSAIVAMPG